MGIADLVAPDGKPVEVITQSDELKIPDKPFYFDYVDQGISKTRWPAGWKGQRPSADSECPRCLYLNLIWNPKPPPSLDDQKRMDAGTFVHEKWEKYFMHSGLLFSTKHQIFETDPINMSGEPDFVIMHPDTGEIFLIEFKSRDHFAFEKQAAATFPHRIQWTDYAWLTGVHKGWIHYEDLGSPKMWKAYPMIYNEKWMTKHLGVLKVVQDLAFNFKPMPGPNITYSPVKKKPKNCKWCEDVLKYHKKVGFTLPKWTVA